MNLREKQKAFCDFYIETLNATESYKRVYSTNNQKTAEANASRLLSNAKVKKYIEERMKEIESDRIAKAEEVLIYLTSGMRGEILEEVVASETIDGMIKPIIIKKQLSAKDQIKCAELLGKRYRLFTDKVEANVNQVVVFSGEDELED